MVSSKRSFSVNPFSSFKMLLQGPLEAPLSLVGGACGPPLCGPTFSSTRPPTWRSSLRTAPPNRSVFGVASVLLSSLASAPAAFPLLLLHPPGGSKEASLPSNKSATCPSLCTHCVPPPGLSQVIRQYPKFYKDGNPSEDHLRGAVRGRGKETSVASNRNARLKGSSLALTWKIQPRIKDDKVTRHMTQLSSKEE
ncbi:uncharacterized protein LOC129624485 isoform X2 [Bubalus kerabau]|uniref:uncharacterized protein LOC129624485 isoform X2 n=1 Tax=Bubalus carabanensis TaxID=3119969 RepID=UPI00244E9A96|nr:uncharacterized protein LOC129624485 isoform X2 [Bubalus carabanensis]